MAPVMIQGCILPIPGAGRGTNTGIGGGVVSRQVGGSSGKTGVAGRRAGGGVDAAGSRMLTGGLLAGAFVTGVFAVGLGADRIALASATAASLTTVALTTGCAIAVRFARICSPATANNSWNMLPRRWSTCGYQGRVRSAFIPKESIPLPTCLGR